MIKAYLHPNILYLQETKRGSGWNQSNRGLAFPNNLCVYYVAFYDIIIEQKLQYFIAQKLHKNYNYFNQRNLVFKKFFLAHSHFVWIHFCE